MFESIGQRLKKERIARFLTLEKASEATRIRIVFLQALEADDYSVMPSAAQGRGFLRNYAEYLELNIDEMIAEMQRNAPQTAEVSGPLPEVNLAETEIPPLTIEQDEKSARPSLTLRLRSAQASRLGRRPKAKSVAEMESTESAQGESPAPAVATVETEIEPPKPRSRKKKKVEKETVQPVIIEPVPQQAEVGESNTEELSLPVEQDQVEVNATPETKPGLLSRLMSTFQFRFGNVKRASNQESAPVVEAKPEWTIPSQPADVIFAEIGALLRERRELISLTLDEVERHTKLRAAFLKALEEGAFDKLPSPVQTRGMLANYATFLDLDTDTILLRFADGLQARRHEKYAETPREKIQTEVVTSMPFLRSFIAGDLIFGVVMIAILFALAIWGVGRLVNSQEKQSVQVTAPSIVDVLGSTPLPTASLEVTSVPVTKDPLATPGTDLTTTPGSNANVVVSLFAVERVFTRISVDGKVVFEGRIAPGETKEFDASDQVMVLTGNAAALRITYNGRDLGLMGNVGEVISRVYLISGIVTPTATISPTPTNTLPVTPTLTPTFTPTFTPTARPPDGG